MKISHGLPNPLSSFLTDSVPNFRIRGTSYWEGTTGFDGGCVRVQDTDGNFLRTSSSSQVSGNILHRLNEPEWYFLMSELFFLVDSFFLRLLFFHAFLWCYGKKSSEKKLLIYSSVYWQFYSGTCTFVEMIFESSRRFIKSCLLLLMSLLSWSMHLCL